MTRQERRRKARQKQKSAYVGDVVVNPRNLPTVHIEDVPDGHFRDLEMHWMGEAVGAVVGDDGKPELMRISMGCPLSGATQAGSEARYQALESAILARYDDTPQDDAGMMSILMHQAFLQSARLSN